MSVDDGVNDSDRKKNRYHFDRHSPDYRSRFKAITEEMHAKCPMAWTDTYGGHWVAAGSHEVFELARCPAVSNDHDINGERRGYKGISIPTASHVSAVRGGILEMDDPEHRIYRTVLNPYLSPAAVKRWEPFIDEVTRAALDEKIEEGSIDFVDDLANIVPAVLTLAMLGIPLKKWKMYSEPVHAAVYTPEHSPDIERVTAMHREMGLDMVNNMLEIRENPRPGIVNALLQMRIDGEPAPDLEILGNLGLVIGGGFDTTTALTAHSLEWLSEHPEQRQLLSDERKTLLDPATEEFLRYFTPAPGDGRTFSEDFELDGTVFKSMLIAVLDRMPDYRCDPEGTVHYETIGVIQGMRKLPATFTPGRRIGAGLDETLEKLQRICDEQELARPITERKEAAVID
ncbi:cytochrome P450 [Mycobacterium avium subsp. paratuberculosis]|uniref:cytochrome P450 n=1 Tax=Mycobacterium avium TaxID=1764 RepID=UPI000213A9A0|nr:cytochrome P450 [Mycobacterium avium]ETB10116.1 cytochrome P450 [Mycobacterium avium subsp. paratuberculosis 08-8281]ETB37065.1 cytochrome P450 [Mycobacterium avium subsp. paratuberculosis 11-1786]QPM72415.1 cytochrome P450 [Mycobacterium avium subsp. paratuberculosis S397]QQK51175.1 cytochrome P450 [Mycobacterium avium subsp. paratuberculosis]WAI53395.1 cytochrome P450 [Mycobacterium avium subsp. paratuberculosis]